MNELKPEDVMRACECCACGDCADDKCPLFEWGDLNDECKDTLIANALALLREKDSEIERLEQMNKDYVKTGGRIRAERDRYKAESEQYQIEMLKRGKEIERLRAECASFEEINEMWVEENNRLKEAIKTARAEATTEFAERLKKFYSHLKGNTVGGSVEYHIDQIAKEMKEDQK